MFNESTENLLHDLENDLTDFELESRKEEVFESETIQVAPVPAKRSFVDSTENHGNPVPAARKLQTLDKNEKNDENEIIQLSSISSSASENHKNFSQNINEKNGIVSNKILVAQKTEAIAEETFSVHKPQRVQDKKENSANDSSAKELQMPSTSIAVRVAKSRLPHLDIITEKPEKGTFQTSSVSSSSAQSSFDSVSNETSSSSEESLKARKMSKKNNGQKKKSKKKLNSADQPSSSEKSIKKDENRTDARSANIGIFLHSTGIIKYKMNLKSPRVKISFYNQDSGKQIGISNWSNYGTFNDDFHNLICTWNEMLVIEHDLKRLKEIYNNVLVFFEIINSDADVVSWAFIKLFSSNFVNIGSKFQLQMFKQQKVSSKNLFSTLCGNMSPKEMNTFDQWRLPKREKFNGILNVSLKGLNSKPETEQIENTLVERKISVEKEINRRWQKLPGQACKIPNKTFHKTSFNYKGSMNIKFSHDGNFLAFTEVTKSGTVLHIQKFPEMQEVFTMLEHSDLIHDIDWLKLSQYSDGRQCMLTSSSDFTAIVWHLEMSSYTYNILPHPSFVYASKFLQSDDSSRLQVVTGGRDCVVRVWLSRRKTEPFELFQELKHPNINKSSYITMIATRNAETFYTSSSNGDIIEWTLQISKNFHLNRHFKLNEIRGKIITSLELHPRGNKIFFRVQDFLKIDEASTIFTLGIPTGLITQRISQSTVSNKSQGKLKVTTCGTYLFASNGSFIRFYSLLNGDLTQPSPNSFNIKILSSEIVSAMDYHPKDFYFACSVYGPNGGIIISNYESETCERQHFDKLKSNSNLVMLKPHPFKLSGIHFTDIIQKLDEVFLAPINDNDDSKRHESMLKFEENTCSIGSKRSRTYTVSQDQATYTIQRSQNNTYDIQQQEVSDDDDTTISESFN